MWIPCWASEEEGAPLGLGTLNICLGYIEGDRYLGKRHVPWHCGSLWPQNCFWRNGCHKAVWPSIWGIFKGDHSSQQALHGDEAHACNVGKQRKQMVQVESVWPLSWDGRQQGGRQQCPSFHIFQRCWLELAQHWWFWVALVSPCQHSFRNCWACVLTSYLTLSLSYSCHRPAQTQRRGKNRFHPTRKMASRLSGGSGGSKGSIWEANAPFHPVSWWKQSHPPSPQAVWNRGPTD